MHTTGYTGSSELRGVDRWALVEQVPGQAWVIPNLAPRIPDVADDFENGHQNPEPVQLG